MQRFEWVWLSPGSDTSFGKNTVGYDMPMPGVLVEGQSAWSLGGPFSFRTETMRQSIAQDL